MANGVQHGRDVMVPGLHAAMAPGVHKTASNSLRLPATNMNPST